MLETLILSDNRIEKKDGLLELEPCGRLTCLGLAGNPILKVEGVELEEVWRVLGLGLLITEETAVTLVVFDIRKDCTVMDYRNTKSLDMAKDLIWEVFDIDNRKFIDLRKYLRELKSQTKSLP